jgi:hypothetical protein
MRSMVLPNTSNKYQILLKITQELTVRVSTATGRGWKRLALAGVPHTAIPLTCMAASEPPSRHLHFLSFHFFSSMNSHPHSIYPLCLTTKSHTGYTRKQSIPNFCLKFSKSLRPKAFVKMSAGLLFPSMCLKARSPFS